MLRKDEIDNIIKGINNLIKIDYPYHKIDYSCNILSGTFNIRLLYNLHNNNFDWDFIIYLFDPIKLDDKLSRKEQMISLELLEL